MAKYRPADPGELSVKAGEYGWAALLGGVQIVSGFVGVRWHKCGNPDCGSVFQTIRGRKRPKFCKSCGAEIDWSPQPKATHLVNACLQCSKRYGMEDKFCERDGSGLQVRELPP